MSKHTVESSLFPGARYVPKLANVTSKAPDTLCELMEEGSTKSQNGPFMGHFDNNNMVWSTYHECMERVDRIASGLAYMEFGNNECIGIFSINRPEWVLTEHACYQRNLTVVPLYDTLGADAIQHIIHETGMRALFITSNLVDSLPKYGDGESPLTTLFIIDETSCDFELRDGPFRIMSLAKLEAIGAGNLVSQTHVTKDSIATICYTSGTSGSPKGVILTHGNFTSVVASIRAANSTDMLYTVSPEDVYLSFLPLAHVFERVIQCYLISQGARIAFYSGDVKKLPNDLQIVRPTCFAGVPRVFDKIFAGVWDKVNKRGKIASFVFRKAFEFKCQRLHARNAGKSTFAFVDGIIDRLFQPVGDAFGGRMRLLFSGSAPLRPDVMDFLRCCIIGAQVYEGYGLTETCAAISMTEKDEVEGGHAGVPFACGLVKLREDTGEILVRGDQVFKGYFRQSELTKESFDEDGWFKTGDSARWDDKGRLVITGRIKETFKLAQGEFINPERVENTLSTCPKISSIYVYGDSRRHYTVAIATCEGESVPSETELLANITKTGKEKGLKSFEIPKCIHVDNTSWTVDNGMMTPTMKIRRRNVYDRYKDVIEEMYRNSHM